MICQTNVNDGPGAQYATGSSTLVKGLKNVIVDTGNPSEKDKPEVKVNLIGNEYKLTGSGIGTRPRWLGEGGLAPPPNFLAPQKNLSSIYGFNHVNVVLDNVLEC